MIKENELCFLFWYSNFSIKNLSIKNATFKSKFETWIQEFDPSIAN